MIFWLSRCKVCGSVFREHNCVGMPLALPTVTYTQLAIFEEKEERDED